MSLEQTLDTLNQERQIPVADLLRQCAAFCETVILIGSSHQGMAELVTQAQVLRYILDHVEVVKHEHTHTQ